MRHIGFLDAPPFSGQTNWAGRQVDGKVHRTALLQELSSELPKSHVDRLGEFAKGRRYLFIRHARIAEQQA